MTRWVRERSIRLLLQLVHLLGNVKVSDEKPRDETESGVEHIAPRPVVTQFTPVEYGEMLKAEVVKTEYLPQFWLKGDDRIVPLDSSEGKREDAVRLTWCNRFVRNVCKWFGWNDFEAMDRDQAGEMVKYMVEHKKVWPELFSQEAAMGYACMGRLVIAGDATPDGNATGHVAIIAPVPEMGKSAKWGCKVAIMASVGKKNEYGHGTNWYFGSKPRLFLYTPQA